MSDQTFHTPSFGDEEFDIPVDLNPPSYQIHSDLGSLISDQQTAGYDQHQWHPQANQMMPNQTFLQTSTDHSNYHPHQQMIMMQQPTAQVHPVVQQASGIVPPHQPQMSSVSSAGGSNYIGQSSPQNAPINSNENGSTSDESDDNALNDPNTAFQHPSPDSFENEETKGTGKKTAGKAASAKVAAKKKKRDPNEPQKPVSAYALFFRDTQAAIKGQNPNASFGEVSKIVASMWDVLAPDHKNVYKKRQETAKKDYLKALAAYRAGTLQTSDSTQAQVIQNNQPQAMTAPVINPVNSAQQPQQIMQQNYQFASQPQSAIQSQNAPHNNQQANQQTIATQQQQQAQQFANQQPVQQNFQQQSQIINNNPLPPPVVVNQQANAAQNCIRNGCTNPAILSVDWEDEYCSNECCLSHCKDVFSNWVNQNHQQNFPVVS